MIVATQVPRGIHNQVVSNCTTQFFGRQSAPATIAAAQEIITANGGSATDIGKLGRANSILLPRHPAGRQRFARRSASATTRPIHPPREEVVQRARGSAQRIVTRG